MRKRWFWLFSLGVVLSPPGTNADEGGLSASDLTSLSLEELMSVTVVSVSRSEESQMDAAAAIYVLTQEDIRRSGLNSVPELLRLVPGMQVSSIDGSRWAISSRGFNSRFANKLLVLIDGRSVYSPLFSGVHWDVQEISLESIERIEVIRGPGASLWGANAVNGIVNIITRSSADTQGSQVTLGSGTESAGFGEGWVGGRLSEDWTYRAGVRGFSRARSFGTEDFVSHDDWWLGRGELRLDWQGGRDQIMVSGAAFSSEAAQTFLFNSVENGALPSQSRGETHGGHLVLRWARDFSKSSTTTLQLNFDRSKRLTEMFDEFQQTFDVDFQHQLAVGSRNDLIWGGNARVYGNWLGNGPNHDFGDLRDETWIFGGFLQDQWKVIPDRLNLTLGSKLEHHEYTGLEIQPSFRALWRPTEQHSVWTSTSRAIRSPSHTEVRGEYLFQSFVDPELGPLAIVTRGNDSLRAEDLLAVETGYRFAPKAPWSIDVAAFVNDYRGLRSVTPIANEFVPTPAPGYIRVVAQMENATDARGYGAEMSLRYQFRETWRLEANYSVVDIQLRAGRALQEFADETLHQAHLRSSQTHGRFSLDNSLFFTSESSKGQIPAYLRWDAHVGWSPQTDVELRVGGHNLLQAHHQESPDQFWELASEVERAFYGLIRVKR